MISVSVFYFNLAQCISNTSTTSVAKLLALWPVDAEVPGSIAGSM